MIWERFAAATVSLVLAVTAAFAVTDPTVDEAQPAEPTPTSAADAPASTSVTQALQNESGISVQTLCTNCNNADISMGALGNDHVAVICDDLPFASGLGQIYLLSVMPATMVDKVAVRKGAGDPALPGGSVGGAIEIERRQPRPGLQLNALADVGGFGWRGTKLDLSGKSGRVGGFVVGSLAESNRVDANDDGNPDMPSFDRYTVEGAVEVEVGRRSRLGLGLSAYRESQEDGPAAYDAFLSSNTIFNPERRVLYNRENVELDRDQLDAAWSTKFLDGSRLDLQALFVDRDMKVAETEFSPTLGLEFLPVFFSPTYLIDETNRYAGGAWSRRLGADSTLSAGVSLTSTEYEIVDRSYNLLAGNPPDFAFSETVDERGVWLEGKSNVGQGVTVSAGLRWVDFRYEDSEDRPLWTAYELPEGDRILPRAAVTWKPNDHWQLNWSGGAGFRAPQPIYEEVCCGRRYRNNRGISPEHSRALGFEATYQPEPRWKVGAAVSVADFRDRVIKLITLSNQFRPTYQNVNIPSARYSSLSVDGSFELRRWLNVKGSVSWLDAENRSRGDRVPALVDFFGTPEVREFTLRDIPYLAERRASLAFDLRPQWWGVGVTVSTQYTGPMKIQRFADFPEPELGYDESSLYDTGGFWLASLEASKSFGRDVIGFVGIDNITDEVQSTLGDPHFDYNWGALRGRYVYAGARLVFDSRR